MAWKTVLISFVIQVHSPTGWYDFVCLQENMCCLWRENGIVTFTNSDRRARHSRWKVLLWGWNKRCWPQMDKELWWHKKKPWLQLRQEEERFFLYLNQSLDIANFNQLQCSFQCLPSMISKRFFCCNSIKKAYSPG